MINTNSELFEVKFPADFIFGGSLAACQTEGAWNTSGKGPSVADIQTIERLKNSKDNTSLAEIQELLSNQDDSLFPKRNGIDFYHRYKDDLKLISGMNIEVLRISIAWSRIFPVGDELMPNQIGLEYYRDVLQTCKEYGIKTMVTLSHYEMPLGLVIKYNGWLSRDLVGLYTNYCKTVIKEFAELVDYWIPFNEIDSVPRHPFISAGILVNQKNEKNYLQAMHYQFLASANVVKLCKKYTKNKPVGCMLTGLVSYPYSSSPADNNVVSRFRNNMYLSGDVQINGKYPKAYLQKLKVNKIDITEEDQRQIQEYTCDFLAFSYYTSVTLGEETAEVVEGNTIHSLKNPYLDSTAWGWQIDAIGIKTLCVDLYNRFNVPLFIVENGIGVKEQLDKDMMLDDTYRIKYHEEHLKQIRSAIYDENIEVMGYLSWGIIDLVSSSTAEMDKRYGFIFVDYDNSSKGTLCRYPKSSYYWYKNLINYNKSSRTC